MTPTGQRALGGLIGILLFVVLILAASPFINWYNGFGFTWYF